MIAPDTILRLVDRFDGGRSQYTGPAYNETQLRLEFLNPFFVALGWDMDNTQGAAEAYKDVIHEDAVKVGSATKAPDYSFRIGGTRKFFVEAKKPAVNIKEDISPAFQLRRYAWSAKLPLSILTDFDELAVYDCRIKPSKTDKASVARIKYLTYKDYPTHWEEIHSVFSREAVWKGSFDKYVVGTKGKKGTDEVDDAFLKEIESWRDLLARNIALRNPKLSVQELNFAVQRTIDRIIFLRICEDRGIETYGSLQGLVNGERIYKRLCEHFYRADEKYNSGLFHFAQEKGRPENPDGWTLDLKIDDKILKDILGGLYYPDCPYEFSILPADILGQVYEQFLGKVIRLTAGHQAKVEEKPEVKKAGGVYYTPTYIVDYIVKNTVGRLVEGKTPKQVESLRVLDPACGSGSFLIGAYQYLLDWHQEWYTKDSAEKWSTGKNATLYAGPGGTWRLTTAERKRILLNNIYGVDIDSQAVEVTKLSLLLKVLEGENEESIAHQFKLFHERALPDLGSNIKCGNSLIGSDFFEGQLIVDQEKRTRINAFDWKTDFKEIMDAGGFDAVIGNPPYGALLAEDTVLYFNSRMPATGKDPDTYALFMELALRLMTTGGLAGMIVPTGWYSGSKYSALRRSVACTTDPQSFVNLPYDIFDAWVDTTVFCVRKRQRPCDWPRKVPSLCTIRTFPKRHRIISSDEFFHERSEVNCAEWFASGDDEFLTYSNSATSALLKKIKDGSLPLGDCADVQRGVTPFHLTDKPVHHNSRLAFNGTVRRYVLDMGKPGYIRFDDSLAEPKPERYFRGDRLLLRELISRQFRLQAVLAADDFVTNKSMQSILPVPSGPSLQCLLGIINSRLMSWYFLKRSQVGQRDDFPKIVLKESRSLPISRKTQLLGASEPQSRELGLSVEQMLGLHCGLAKTKVDHERTNIQRQIDATDKQIDALVYELYGLTEEEIRIIEGDVLTKEGS
jgi:hypothetical protein